MTEKGEPEPARAEPPRPPPTSLADEPDVAAAATAARLLRRGPGGGGAAPDGRPPLTPGLARALQRAAGNAATARRLAHASGRPARLLRQERGVSMALDEPGPKLDPAKAEWVVPLAVAPARLAALMVDMRRRQAASQRHAEWAQHTAYLVLAGRLLHFAADGRLVDSYALADGIAALPPGYWAGTIEEDIWRRLSRPDPKTAWEFNPWDFESARTPLHKWVVEADGKRFIQNLVAAKTGAIMLAVPPGGPGKGTGAGEGKDGSTPGWADGQARKAQQLADKAVKQATGAKGRDKTRAETDPALKRLPDRLVAWSRGAKTYVNVWADGAHEVLAAHEDETPEQLLERAKDAAQRLRDARDPANSIRVANAPKEGFQPSQVPQRPPSRLLSDYTPDPNRPPMPNKGANVPPYPAQVTMAGADPKRPEDAITVPGATNQFKMAMDWSMGGRVQDTISLVTSQMQVIAYYWEAIRVGHADYARQTAEARRAETEDQLKQAAKVEGGKGESQVKGAGPFGISSGEIADVSRALKNIREDTSADIQDMASMPWPVRQQYLQVIGLSVAVRTIGTLVSSFITRLSMPLDEQRISLDEPGDYVVRCIATPMHDDDATWVRASSVGTMALRVESVRDRARLAADENDREIAGLEDKLRKAPDEKTAASIRSEIEARRLQASSSHLENTSRRLKQYSDELKLARDLKADLDAGRRREMIGADPYAVRKRWLAVRLAEANIDVDDYIAEQERSVKAFTETEARLKGYALEGVTGRSYSPRLTLSSEEDGRTYQLITVLGQTKTLEHDGVVEYRLADVTSKEHQQEFLGSSKAEGATGHREAIRNAFVAFRENNGYGRGTLVIRLPTELDADPAIGPLPMEREMRSAPGARERALQKLKDIATVAEVAGMIVGGPVGLGIGIVGGVAGLALTAENIRKRVTGGRFEWASFETLMDAVSIVGSTVGIGAGVSGAARAGGSAARWAVTAEKLFVPMMKGQLVLQVVILPATAYRQLAALDEQIKNTKPPMSEGEIALRRAEIVSSFAWGAFTTSVSAAQMMGMPTLFGHEAPTDVLPPDHPGAPERTAPEHDVGPTTTPHEPSAHEPGTPEPGARDPAAADGRAPRAGDVIVAETSYVNARNEPHEMHRSRDGAIRRCSWACMLLIDLVRARTAAMEAALPAADGPGGEGVRALLRDARGVIERADRLDARSRTAAAEQTGRQKLIDSLPEGSPARLRKEAQLKAWLEERNRVFDNEARRIDNKLAGIEDRAGIQARPEPRVMASVDSTQQLARDFADVAADPAFRDELQAIRGVEGDPAQRTQVLERLAALHARMVQAVEANIPAQVEAARTARQAVGEGLTGPNDGCLAQSGDGRTRTESGSRDAGDPGITQATDEVLRNAARIGYEFPGAGTLDTGRPGLYYASHAEKQLNALRPDQPIGVSLPMCFDCYTYFRAQAHAMGRPLVVADPEVTRVFYPDGRVVAPSRSGPPPPATGPTVQTTGAGQ